MREGVERSRKTRAERVGEDKVEVEIWEGLEVVLGAKEREKERATNEGGRDNA